MLKFLSSFFNRNFINFSKLEKPESVMKVYLCYALIWSIGGNIQDSYRSKFSSHLKQAIIKHKIYLSFPELETVYDYGIDKNTFSFVNWQDRVENFKYELKMNYFEILVPTTDTVKFKDILKILLNNNNNILFSGETGVGKSVITSDFLTHLGERFQYA